MVTKKKYLIKALFGFVLLTSPLPFFYSSLLLVHPLFTLLGDLIRYSFILNFFTLFTHFTHFFNFNRIQ